MSAPRLLASILLLAPTLILVGSPQARADSSLCDAVAGNLIQNCGFEGSLTNGPGSVPTGWTVSQWTNADGVFGLNYPGYAGYVNSGYYALQIGNDPGEPGYPLFDGAAIVSQSFTDTPGDLLTFSFYLLNGEAVNDADDEFQAFFDSTSGTPLLQILNIAAPRVTRNIPTRPPPPERIASRSRPPTVPTISTSTTSRWLKTVLLPLRLQVSRLSPRA